MIGKTDFTHQFFFFRKSSKGGGGHRGPIWAIMWSNQLTRLPEGLERFLKRENSSEFNPQAYEQVKSSPSVKVWLHEALISTQKSLNRPNKEGRDFVSFLHLSVFCLGVQWEENFNDATSLTWQSRGSWRDGSSGHTAATTSVIKVPRPLVVSGPPNSVRHGHGRGGVTRSETKER